MLPAARAKVMATLCHDRIEKQLQTDAALIVVGDTSSSHHFYKLVDPAAAPGVKDTGGVGGL